MHVGTLVATGLGRLIAPTHTRRITSGLSADGDVTGGGRHAGCSGGSQNGTETDVDCGGTMCRADTDSACTDPVCGRGATERPEDCDDGSGSTATETATCDVDCTSDVTGLSDSQMVAVPIAAGATIHIVASTWSGDDAIGAYTIDIATD